MEDTPMLAQGLRYNWRDRLVLMRDDGQARDKSEYIATWPNPETAVVCPVCYPISKERMDALGEDGVMSPRLCRDRYGYRVRAHARYIQTEMSGA